MSDIFHVLADSNRRDILLALLDAKAATNGEADAVSSGIVANSGASAGAVSGVTADTESVSGEMRVSDLVEQLELSQPAVSKHLKALREAGVVTVREAGASRYYSLLIEPFIEVEDFILRFLHSDIETVVSFEYVSEDGDVISNCDDIANAAHTDPLLPEQVARAASEVGKAAAIAAKPVKQLVARFSFKN